VDWGPVREVVKAAGKPVVFSGGVTTLDEIARFKELGAHGIIVGSALYLDRMDFAEAKARAR
jgi:phosphoribosylformimino-5-aminoimidazole carboxamide ribotide isomerase